MKIKAFSASRLVVCLSGIIYLAAMHAVIPNNGGSGVDMPESLLVWSLALLMLAGGFLFFCKERIYISPTLKYITLAVAVMTLPLAWSRHADWILDALPRFGGMWAGVLLYTLFLNCRFSATQVKYLLSFISIAAFIQALYALAGLHMPYLLPTFEQEVLAHVSSSVGVFQQRNVTASFIAVGGGGLLFMLGSSFFRLENRRTDALRKGLITAGVVTIYCALTEIQSRIGWLSGLCVFIGMLALYWRKEASASTRLLILTGPLAGFFCGMLLMHGTLLEALQQHDGSNLQRMMILHETWRMILMHPFKGWGYGSYVWSFTHFIADRAFPIDTGGVSIPHPHNEFLYWWVEGGLVAMVGVAILCYAGIRLLFPMAEKNTFAVFICALPLLLHTQVEYPFYQSATHWLTLILLISLMDNKAVPGKQLQVKKFLLNVITGIFSLFSILMVIIIVDTLWHEVLLTKFDKNPNKYYKDILLLNETGVGTERLRKDQAEALIVDYQHNSSIDDLVRFSDDGHRWIQTWIDADMYDNLINIDYFLGNARDGNNLKDEARKIFVSDKRFY
ncbi:TPA: Wzy polymerase domain-containing protein [Citrobacter freundii]